MRTSFQSGSVIRVPLKSGDAWRFRYRSDGVQRSEFLGTVAALPTKAHAEKAADRFRRQINTLIEVVTIADLIAKFWLQCPPDRPATAHSYRSIFNRIEAEFGQMRVDAFTANILAVESWLKGLKVIGRHPKGGKPMPVSPLYRSQVRNLLHLLIERAMLWGHLPVDRNPMETIRLKNGSQRKKELTILTLDQYQALLDDPELPLLVKTMIQVTTSLGLRVSELLGLRWSDISFPDATIQIQRSVVNGQANDTKTVSSKQVLPLHESIIGVLLEWRNSNPIISGWVFGSPRTGRPYDRDSLRAEYLQPAGERIGVKHLGWHSLRHLYRAMLREVDTPIEVQKNLLRHSKLATTMDVYGGRSRVEELRPANARVVSILARKSA